MKKAYVAIILSLIICASLAIADDMYQTRSNIMPQNVGNPAQITYQNCQCNTDACPSGAMFAFCGKLPDGTCHTACASYSFTSGN